MKYTIRQKVMQGGFALGGYFIMVMRGKLDSLSKARIL
jgi:hypothetical protein